MRVIGGVAGEPAERGGQQGGAGGQRGGSGRVVPVRTSGVGPVSRPQRALRARAGRPARSCSAHRGELVGGAGDEQVGPDGVGVLGEAVAGAGQGVQGLSGPVEEDVGAAGGQAAGVARLRSASSGEVEAVQQDGAVLVGELAVDRTPVRPRALTCSPRRSCAAGRRPGQRAGRCCRPAPAGCAAPSPGQWRGRARPVRVRRCGPGRGPGRRCRAATACTCSTVVWPAGARRPGRAGRRAAGRPAARWSGRRPRRGASCLEPAGRGDGRVLGSRANAAGRRTRRARPAPDRAAARSAPAALPGRRCRPTPAGHQHVDRSAQCQDVGAGPGRRGRRGHPRHAPPVRRASGLGRPCSTRVRVAAGRLVEHPHPSVDFERSGERLPRSWSTGRTEMACGQGLLLWTVA